MYLEFAPFPQFIPMKADTASVKSFDAKISRKFWNSAFVDIISLQCYVVFSRLLRSSHCPPSPSVIQFGSRGVGYAIEATLWVTPSQALLALFWSIDSHSIHFTFSHKRVSSHFSPMRKLMFRSLSGWKNCMSN